MAQTTHSALDHAVTWRKSKAMTDPAVLHVQGHEILHAGFVVLPIVAGMDKFFYYLAYWPGYLAPVFPRILGISDVTFMYGVGVVEMVVGIGVALRPQYFAYALTAWLGAIIVNLLVLGNYYDVALRDFGLAIAAFALANFSLAKSVAAHPRNPTI